MHPYSINSHERRSLPFYLAGVSILFAFGLKYLVDIPDWLPIPSVFAAYGVSYTLFDKVLWKLNILRKIGLIKTPDLNGTWKMVTTSSLNNHTIEYIGRLKIEQTWTHISLYFEGSNATSSSKISWITITNNSIYTLEWQYLSKRKPEFAEDEYMHYGITKVQSDGFDIVDDCMEGDYYTDRSRDKYGRVKVIREK